ncbi:unnamed protein product [Rotaria sp. Silwood2]|nr:unnamed protein product [Rotaria sp. Silwood2]CAF2776896.1 unnamed protein product [Rotaria sp. Silwood2]CAF2951574.1 unnamed protein product [Rotaria sp. Silwood2]CAF3937823.1 unnamed protein product [Rotaria sp. Silwood2]CAF4341623.1 unnamed protein product [Rotaria sp. Silwood2]
MTTVDDNIETFSLIWLDAAVNSSKENIQAQPDLRAIINYLKVFENVEKCEKYIRKSHESDRIVLIVSGGLGQEIVPRIHKLRQLCVIYIYCMNKKKNKKWASQYSKIKLITTDLDDLIHQIEKDHVKTKKVEEQFGITFLERDSVADRSSFGLNGQYLQFQLLMDSLLRIQATEEDKKELISICKTKYKDNKKELDNVHEFKNNYKPDKALWWYTRESFLYRMLNKALRVQDTELLYLLRFFIFDLCKAIEKHRCSTPICTYRSQSISEDEFRGLSNSIGKLISMSSFFSTSLDPKKALDFADPADDLRQIFFEIDADPRIHGVQPFAEVAVHSAHPEEREVLMTVGSIYRILDVSRGDGKVWTIKMRLCSEDENNMRRTLEHMIRENLVEGYEQRRLLFATRLMNMNKLDEAEKHLIHLYDTLPRDHKDIVLLYSKLGDLAFEKDDLATSLKWHQKALKRKNETLKPNDTNLADSYNSIGNVYAKQNAYPDAHKSYNKAMEIWKRAFGEDHLAIASYLTNIGNVFNQEKRYSEALQCHNKALMIRKKFRPSDHPDMAASLNNLGLVYKCNGRLQEALKYFEQSLVIKEKSLSFQHPSIGSTWENMASVFEQSQELHKALIYYKKTAECYRLRLGPTNRRFVNVEQSIRNVESKLKKK